MGSVGKVSLNVLSSQIFFCTCLLVSKKESLAQPANDMTRFFDIRTWIRRFVFGQDEDTILGRPVWQKGLQLI
jgi:hypothetical protein